MTTFRDLRGISSFDPDEGEAYKDDPLFMRSVARTVAVMSAFQSARHPLSLSQVATAAGVDRSAAQRIVHSLLKLGMLTRDPEDRGYLPGLRVLDMTHDLLRLNPMLQRANPVMLELRRRVRERVDLSLFDDVRVVYALRMPSKHEIFSATIVGHAVPTYCTAGGIAILSLLPDEKVADIVKRSDLTPFTRHTIRTLDEVMVHVHATRERGHSVLCRQLLNHEVAIGAPIRDSSGAPIGAIHVAGSLQEWTAESFSDSFGPLVQNAAQTVSEKAPIGIRKGIQE
ncbi:IclR family pca regulon transcriptional regulator [Phyllobacterium ifriqiyense]|uniref:IclR family pca regulon transcriptional regulator n=1 Tax=Phyllobacterium ifriqiyense TaxID=314238 RepID=A0ABU0S2Y0_9HYPH|nr:IclR family transcriptional regulator [Phyllobacterium ifriqiyense]MDQ0995135.1 IclR family pca regulon transcriptional regulator [Phyllobacterium ifriqiyense]